MIEFIKGYVSHIKAVKKLRRNMKTYGLKNNPKCCIINICGSSLILDNKIYTPWALYKHVQDQKEWVQAAKQRYQKIRQNQSYRINSK